MALKIRPTTPGGTSGLYEVPAADPFGSTGSHKTAEIPVKDNYDYATRNDQGAQQKSGVSAADYPYTGIASITSTSQAGAYSTVNLYTAPNNPVTMTPSSSYRRRIQTNHGNVGLRG